MSTAKPPSGGKTRTELRAEADRALSDCINSHKGADGNTADSVIVAEMATWWRAHAEEHQLFLREAERQKASYNRRAERLRLDKSAPLHQGFLLEHLPYEIDMLRSTMTLINSGCFTGAIKNALIESFAIHARNLTDFFRVESENPQRDDVFASDFTNKDYEPCKDNSPPEALIVKINKQVAHLTLTRPSALPGIRRADGCATSISSAARAGPPGPIRIGDQGLGKLKRTSLII
jgi:hypothetical protein